MKLPVKQVVSLVAVFLFFYPLVIGQGLADTTRLEKKISVLNKKVFIDVPAAAIVSPRVADIMAADPNENRETRIIADWGKMKLVLFAQELYALSGSTLFEDMSKQVEPDFDFQRKVLKDNDSLISVISTPTLFDTSANGILVNSLLIKIQDNSVCRIDAYINPEAYVQKDEFIRLTEDIFKTISKGTRTVNLSAREETFAIPGSVNKFIFELPKNYFVTVDEKFDFSVFKLTKYKNLTDKIFSNITIYTGFHPSLFHKGYGFTDSNAIKTNGRFLQNNVEWLYFSDNPNSFYLKEQIIPSDNIEKGFLLHIALLSNKKDMMEELTKIIESIKLIK